jgi:hypothetical protein
MRDGSDGKRQRIWREGNRRTRRRGKEVVGERRRDQRQQVGRRRTWCGRGSERRICVAMSSGRPGIRVSEGAEEVEEAMGARMGGDGSNNRTEIVRGKDVVLYL